MTAVNSGHAPLTRFDFRIESARKQIIEQAASLLGMSLTQFAKTALIDRAQEVVRQHTTTVLSDNDRDIFLAALDSDAKPNAAARRAAARFKKLRNRP
jgi:uncharacterized protein (DUF1778 family)